uniref:Uncharacterized protein n=2 Tax=Opuntia streptacantha TaxID=393608 RepID=A0A7C9DYE5_OPUST
MANPLSLLFFFFFSSVLILLSRSSANPNPNPKPLTLAHKELTSYGFPVGLLPTNVHGYALNQTSGEFVVDLGDQCKITLPPDNYLAAYSKTVRGKIVKNKIAELHGIRVRALFKWWSITGIRSSDDNLVFEVGAVSVKYPSKNFDESPSCEGRKADS